VRVEVAKLCDDLKGDLLVSLHVGLSRRRPQASIGVEESVGLNWRRGGAGGLRLAREDEPAAVPGSGRPWRRHANPPATTTPRVDVPADGPTPLADPRPG
jgi:hypothetical protein